MDEPGEYLSISGCLHQVHVPLRRDESLHAVFSMVLLERWKSEKSYQQKKNGVDEMGNRHRRSPEDIVTQ